VLGEEPAIWDTTYGGQARETVNSMLMTDDGGYALAGYTYSFGAGDQDVWLVKTDSAGNVKWNQTYGGAAHEAAHTFLKTDEGGYLLAGFSASYGSGDTDVFLIKADAQGVIPEFPSWMIIPLFLITTLIVVLYRNRLREMA
jgi:hypothetical protein